MPRLTPVDPTHASGEAKRLLDAVQAALGATPNMFRTIAHSGAALSGYLNLAGALKRGALSDKVAEQIALTVAEANRCDYCLSAHSYLGREAGLTQADLDASREGQASDPKVEAVLRLAQALTDRRGDISDHELAEARRAGLSDAEIAETVAHVALNVFTNYFNKLAQTEVDFPRVTAGATR